MKSKTLIEKQTKRKNNIELVETIRAAKKNDSWIEVANVLSYPRRKKTIVNLSDIEKASKEGDLIVVPGKVLSGGEITKKIRIVAMQFSKAAKEKILNSKNKIEMLLILEEIKKNPKAQGVKILKNG